MRAVNYRSLMANEPTPFTGIPADGVLRMTFRIEDRDGVRFDLAAMSAMEPRRMEWLWPGTYSARQGDPD